MPYTRKSFIALIAPLAVQTMIRTNISAALTIAQACLESANGNSGLTTKANNLFGIKGRGNAGSIVMRTREQRKNGTVYYVDANFAAYTSWQASIDGRTDLLLKGVSWNPKLYHPVIGKRGREAARAIQAAGYATDLKYAELLISVMDAYNLYQYDQVAAPAAAEEKPVLVEGQFKINGKDAGDTFIINGRTYVQMRELGDFYGVDYDWNNEKKTAKFNNRDVQCFHLGEDGRVYVQLKAIAQAYGGKVDFDNKSKTTYLQKPA